MDGRAPEPHRVKPPHYKHLSVQWDLVLKKPANPQSGAAPRLDALEKLAVREAWRRGERQPTRRERRTLRCHLSQSCHTSSYMTENCMTPIHSAWPGAQPQRHLGSITPARPRNLHVCCSLCSPTVSASTLSVPCSYFGVCCTEVPDLPPHAQSRSGWVYWL